MFGKIFEKVKPALKETWQILSNAGTIAIDIAQGIINNWDRISPVVYTLVGAITAYNIATTIRNNKELIYAGIIKTKMALDTAQAILTGQLTIKQWALNAAMNANPIGLIITAIAILVGIIWTAWKNWDKISKWMSNRWDEVKKGIKAFCDILKNIFLKVWDVVVGAWNYAKEVISGVCDVLVGIFMPIWNAVCDGVTWFKNIVLGVCDVVGGIFTAIWDGVVKALDKLKEGFNKVTDFITGAFMSAWDSLMKALDAILHPIETAKKAFGGLIDKLKFWNNTKAEDKTININEIKRTDNIGGSNKTGITTSTVKNPRHALGTAYFKGGVTGINEGGRDETAVLPAGTKILSHEEGKVIEKKNNKSITVNIYIDGNFIGEKEHMEKYGEYTANKILAALNNM